MRHLTLHIAVKDARTSDPQMVEKMFNRFIDATEPADRYRAMHDLTALMSLNLARVEGAEVNGTPKDGSRTDHFVAYVAAQPGTKRAWRCRNCSGVWPRWADISGSCNGKSNPKGDSLGTLIDNVLAAYKELLSPVPLGEPQHRTFDRKLAVLYMALDELSDKKSAE